MNIFYFSGTGNSLKAAMDIGNRIKESQIIPIKKLNFRDYKCDSSEFLLITPLYYYGLPVIVEDFIKKIDLNSVSYISCIITAMYPNGLGLEQLRILLKERKRELNYGVYLKMPTNYVSFFEPLSEKKRDKLLSKSAGIIDQISYDIRDKKNSIQRESKIFNIINNSKKMYKKWRERVFITDENFIINKSCSTCNLCSEICPVKNIEIEDSKPIFKNRCQQCYACINLCPQKAIGYKKMKSGRYIHPDITIKQLIGR